MSTKTNRAIAAAVAASIAVTTFGLAPAAASPLPTEIGYRHRDGAAAALGAFAAIAGTIAAIAAARHDRDYDGDHYAYGDGPDRYRHDGWGGWHGHWYRR
jgi:hypothetical protein